MTGAWKSHILTICCTVQVRVSLRLQPHRVGERGVDLLLQAVHAVWVCGQAVDGERQGEGAGLITGR